MTKAPLILAALLPYVSSAGGPIRIALAGDAQAVARARVLVDGRPLPAGGQLSDEDYPAQHCVRIEGEGVYVHHWNAVGPRYRYPQLDDSFWIMGSPDATNAVTHTATLTTHAVWVDPKGGRDAPEAAGTADDPFRTLVYAAQRAEKTSVVFCAPGDYAEGEALYASVTNRVHDFNKALFFRGCGADRCRLVGRLDPTDPEDGRGPAAIRCAAFQNAASALQGFTVTDGRVSSTTGKADAGNQGGAGFNVNFVDCTITNCAAARGQVGRGGSVTRCRIAGNTVANTEGGRLFEDTCPVYSSICFRQNGNGAAPAQQANCPLYQCTVYPGKINGNYPATVLGSGGTLWNCAAKSSGSFSTSWSASATGCVWQWDRQPGGSVVASDHTDADPHFADWENGDCRLVEPTPAEGAGVLPPDYYTWYCTDVNGNPVVFRDGRPLPGAVQAVFGTNWYVNAARPDDAGYGTSPASAKRTLAALCRSADLRSGDVVHVAPGTYGEGCVRAAETDVSPNRAVVPEGVTLVSDAGAEATVIRGAKTDGNLGTNSVRGVYLGKGARLVGFTVCDASPAVSEDAEDGFGGGIYACADCVIADCIVRDNRAMRGGAVRASGGVQILRCRFSGNMARNGASGIYGGGYACCNCDIRCDSGYFSYPGSPSTLYLNCTFGGAGEALRLLSGGTAVNCLFDGCGIKDDGTTYRRCLFPSEEFYGKVSAHCEDCIVGGAARDGGSNELYLASVPSALLEEADRDIGGNRRIQGAAIDVGCDEYDLLTAYSRALAPEGAVKVVEEDGEVAEPAAGGLTLRPGASLTLGLQGSGPAEGLDAVMAVRVSGSGTFRLLQGETELFSARSSDGRTTFSFRMEKDVSYRIVYGGADGEAAVEPLRLTDPAIAASANFSLAGGDGRDAVIVVANPGLPSAELAAQEIQTYVRRITRRTLAVTTQRQAARRIVVGLVDAIEDLPEAGRRTLGGTDDPEASWTGTDGRTLWIAGKQPIAELYAAYHFLEAKLGVRWFKGATALDPGDFVPTADVLEIAPYAEFRKPSFPVRRLEGLTRANELKGAAVAVRNGYQVPPSNVAQLDNATLRAFFAARCPNRLYGIGGRHVTFLDSVPTNWFATHPEYFPEIDGVRTGDERVSRHRCMSNPDVRRLVAEDVLRRFEASGGTGYFHYGNWDAAEGHCECADCVALDPPEEPMYGRGSVNVTTRFLKTANAIARAVWEVRPEAEQHVWAYQCYRRPPVGERPDPRFWVQYCPHGRCYGHALDDVNCTYNRTQAEWFKDWAAISSHVYSYEYGTCVDSASLYVCMEVTEPRDVRFYGKIGVAGWRESINFSDVTPSDNLDPVATTDLAPSNWQRFYVTGHVLWDVDVDEAALLEDAESRYYGAAYPAMRKYQDLRRRLWLNNSFCYGYSVGTDRAVRQLDAPLAEERLSGWLDEAERLAAGDPVLLERIGYDRTFFGRYLVAPHRPLASDGCIHALRRTTRIVLDGADDEGAWAGSSAITHFSDAHGAPMPAVLRTEAALLFDDEALYVLVHAREPDAVAAGDGLRLAFDLPDTNGTRRVGAFLGADGTVSGDFGGAAVVRRTSDGWTLEARLSCEGVFPLRDGDLWRAEIRRVRAAGDWTNGVASDGGETWRPLFIGRPYLVNSALTEPSDRPDDPNAILKGWTLSSGSSIAAVPNGAGYALSFGSHAIHQAMAGGALAMAGEPRTFDYEIRARGTGQLNVGFYRYGNPTYGKKGAQTTLIEIKRDRTIGLQAESRVYGGTWTIAANEWSGISLSRGGTGDVIVESMAVRPRDGRRRTLADVLAETSGGKLATYRAEGGTPPAHGAECPLHVEGFSGPDAELPASGETESSVAALAARLEIAPVPGLVARPFVRADGALMVRYAAAPEMARRTADEPDPVVFGSSGEGVSLSLRVTNPVRGFWYGLMSSTTLTDAFARQGAAIQSDGSDVRLASPASQDPARFYRASVWPLNPDETAP